MVMHIPVAFLAFYYGAFVDIVGRKKVFYGYIFASLISQGLLILNAYYLEEWPNYYYLFTVALPTTLAGGFATKYMAMTAFISDVTSPENIAFRLGVIHIVGGIATPIATKFGAILLKEAGYVTVFSTSLGIQILSVIVLYYSIRKYKWSPPKLEEGKKRRSLFSPLVAWDSIKTVFKKRPGKLRLYILVLLTSLVLLLSPFIGEHTISFIYVRTRYHWDYVDYSDYRMINEIVSLVGQTIVIPLITYFRFKNAHLLIVILLSVMSRHILKGFAAESWMYYLGGIIDFIGSYSFSLMRAMLSECVPKSEIGKILSLFTCAESIIPIGTSQLYSSLWKKVGDTLPGLVYFVSASFSAVNILLAIFLAISLKGQNIAYYYEQWTGQKLDTKMFQVGGKKGDEEEANQNEESSEDSSEKEKNAIDVNPLETTTYF